MLEVSDPEEAEQQKLKYLFSSQFMSLGKFSPSI